MKTIATIENITPVKATEWLEMTYEKQRKIAPPRVKFYAEQIERGNWQPTSAIAIAMLDNDCYLINGNHTLRAVIKSDGKIEGYPVHKHYCESMNQVNDLYAHWDNQKPRNYADSLVAYGIDDDTGLTVNELQKLTTAILFMNDGYPRAPRRALMDHQDKIALLYEWLNEFRALNQAITPCDSVMRNKIYLSGVLPIALITIRYKHDHAIAFWDKVARPEMIKRNDPRMALNRALLTWITRGTQDPNGVVPGEFSRAAAYAWNKFISGNGLTLIKRNVATMDKPIKIADTPYRG